MQGRLDAAVLGAALATVAGCASNVSTDYNPNTGADTEINHAVAKFLGKYPRRTNA